MERKAKFLLVKVGWFLLWTFIYSILYLIFLALLPKMFGSYHFFQIKLLQVLIFGLSFSILSRIIHSLIHKSKIYIGNDVFFFWTFAYGFSIWLFEFLKGYLISDLGILFLANKWIGIIFVGLGVCLAIRIIKRMEFKRVGIRSPFGRAPSQIFTGIVLLVIGILCWRFSGMVFLEWFNWAEGMAWSWLIGFAFIIAGFLTLLAWWRNNVSMFTTRHRVNWH